MARALRIQFPGAIYHVMARGNARLQPADVVIEPDVTGFDLAAFTRTDELAAIGEQTTKEAISQIKTLLNRLDSKLFPTVDPHSIEEGKR